MFICIYEEYMVDGEKVKCYVGIKLDGIGVFLSGEYD